METQQKLRLLVECATFYGRALDEPMVRMYLDDLEDVSDEEFRQALKAHRNDPERGRFFPLPADIRAKLPSPHPGPDAACGLVLRAFDEGASVVVTDEILQAKALAQPLWDMGDKRGALFAFRDAYARILAASRGLPVWRLSLGSRVEERADAVAAAVAQGLIGEVRARQLLPYLPGEVDPAIREVAGLLSGGNVVAADFRPSTRAEGDEGVSAGRRAVARMRQILEDANAAAERRKTKAARAESEAERARRAELLGQYEALMAPRNGPEWRAAMVARIERVRAGAAPAEAEHAETGGA
jgi:hypothetical protein